MKVTVIGAGNMGAGFVKQLTAAGHQVCVTARSADKAQAVACFDRALAMTPGLVAARGNDALLLDLMKVGGAGWMIAITAPASTRSPARLPTRNSRPDTGADTT